MIRLEGEFRRNTDGIPLNGKTRDITPGSSQEIVKFNINKKGNPKNPKRGIQQKGESYKPPHVDVRQG